MLESEGKSDVEVREGVLLSKRDVEDKCPVPGRQATNTLIQPLLLVRVRNSICKEVEDEMAARVNLMSRKEQGYEQVVETSYVEHPNL